MTLSALFQSAHSYGKTRTNNCRRYALRCCRNCQADNFSNGQIDAIGLELTISALVDVKDHCPQTGPPVYPKRKKNYSCTCPKNIEQKGSRIASLSIIIRPSNVQVATPALPVV